MFNSSFFSRDIAHMQNALLKDFDKIDQSVEADITAYNNKVRMHTIIMDGPSELFPLQSTDPSWIATAYIDYPDVNERYALLKNI